MSFALARPTTTLALDKHSLRSAMRRVRDGLPAGERARASKLACKHVARHLETLELGTVAIYASIGSELDTSELAHLLARTELRVAYPLIKGKDTELEFYACKHAELEADRFQIPSPTSEHPLVPVQDIDCFIVPGLAFDKYGGRLGWGAGYYDRTLIHNPTAHRIGLAYAVQIRTSLPCDERDVPMTAVASETGVITCRVR
ncbi:MAG: 5-formyltetrahydrofolate cyclo-ligase [Deltaproteobacteria bacterium]|nr:5-formyltetrahydrofolate cyclo-ligase [Deltaproteobacteria bacterium]